MKHPMAKMQILPTIGKERGKNGSSTALTCPPIYAGCDISEMTNGPFVFIPTATKGTNCPFFHRLEIFLAPQRWLSWYHRFTCRKDRV
jgi:hypothetical protein